MTEEDKYKNIIENTDDKEIEESSLWKKITKYAKNAGLKVVYSALLLYYASEEKIHQLGQNESLQVHLPTLSHH